MVVAGVPVSVPTLRRTPSPSMTQLLDFVFQIQLFALEFDDSQIVDGMGAFDDLDLLLKSLMATSKFRDVTLQRHP
jgi:hypothetical protein